MLFNFNYFYNSLLFQGLLLFKVFTFVHFIFRFPASQFGTLYGLGIFLAGAFCVLQYALFELTAGPFNGNPFWVRPLAFYILQSSIT